MAQTDVEILHEFGERIFNDTMEIIPNVSGRTRASLRMEANDNEVTIFGNSYIETLVYGRGKTKKDGPGDVINGIKEWVRLKGLNISPFAVAANIHKYGNTLNRIITGVGPVNYIAEPIGLKEIMSRQKIDFFRGALARPWFTKIKSEMLKDLEQ